MFSLAGLVGFCLLVLNPTIAYGRYERVIESTCSDVGTVSLCLDCYTVGLCVSDDPTPSPCKDGMVCQEMTDGDSTFAVCASPDAVPACVCPNDPLTFIPDVYDNQKFIVCINGEGVVQTCDPEFYDPTLQECSTNEPTTAQPSTTTSPNGCTYDGSGGLPEPVDETCVSFRLCLQGDILTNVILCPVNQIFNPITLECQAFEVFSCSDYPDLVGLVGDTNNCSVFHYCINGVEQIDPLICPSNETFNNETSKCDTSDCSSISGCTCTDASTFIQYNCTNYYECVEVSENYFTPVLKQCPPNFYFNPDEDLCEQEVEGCPLSR